MLPLGLGFILIGGFALYFTLTGADPIDALRRALIGAAPPKPLPTGRRPGANPADLPQDLPPGRQISPTAPPDNDGTAQLQPGLAVALAVPGSHLIQICGPGSVAGSEHPYCNAADIGGARPVLVAVFNALLIFARAGGPIHCIIGPSSNPAWTLGQIRSRESGWKPRAYTGPNSHQRHVHFSGWPSVGGGC
jgi:hypothetical protein